MVAVEEMTEYELRRLENIKRNNEMLASLNVHSTLNQLSAQSNLHKNQAKSYRSSPKKKLKTESPIVIRRSLRTRGMAPDPDSASGLTDDFDEALRKHSVLRTSPTKSARDKGPLRMSDAYRGETPYQRLNRSIIDYSKTCEVKEEMETRVLGNVDVKSLELGAENVARLVPGRIMCVKLFPCANMRMVAAGNKFGDVGFWNADSEIQGGDGIYLYHPHPAPVSGISVQPFSITKVLSCCYDGYIRLMDTEKEIFDLVYSSEDSIYSLSQRPNDSNTLYFGEGQGGLTLYDNRTSNCTSTFSLHERRINTIDFNPVNSNIMLTSSSDSTVCTWDLRNIGKNKKPKSLNTVNNGKVVHSAYFSPSGSLIAATCVDDKVKILNGSNFEEIHTVSHNNKTGRWLSPFRGIWGWDDSNIFIGNMKRGVDIISLENNKNVITNTLTSEHMSAIPCRFDAHSFEVGTLAAATGGGQVYLWTSS